MLPRTEDDDWVTLNEVPLSDLTSRLLREHEIFRRELLPALRQACDLGEKTQYPDSYVLRLFLQECLNFEGMLLIHMRDEEERIFPYILMLEKAHTGKTDWRPAPGVASPLMHFLNHDPEAGLRQMIVAIEEKIRNIDYGPAAASALTHLETAFGNLGLLLRNHADLENQIVFARAARLESQLQQTAVRPFHSPELGSPQ